MDGSFGIREDENDPAVCTNIKSMEVSYISADNNEDTSWDSASSAYDYETPAVVSISLELQGGSSVRTFNTKFILPVKNITNVK